MGCHFLFQGIFPAQGWNPHLLRWQVDSLPLSHQGSPNTKTWVWTTQASTEHCAPPHPAPCLFPWKGITHITPLRHESADTDLPCLPGKGTHRFPLPWVRVQTMQQLTPPLPHLQLQAPALAPGHRQRGGRQGCDVIYPPIPTTTPQNEGRGNPLETASFTSLLCQVERVCGHEKLGVVRQRGRRGLVAKEGSYAFVLLEYDCFIMFVFVLYNEVNQLYVYIYPLPLEPPSHLPPASHPLGYHRALSWASCAVQQLPISYLFYMAVHICQCWFPSLPHPLLPHLRPQVCSLRLHLCPFPAKRFISTIFLDSTYIHPLIYNIWFSLAALLHYDRL